MKLKNFIIALIALLTTTGVLAQDNSLPQQQGLNTEQAHIIANLVNNMVYVEGGTFTMGATSEQVDDAYDDEKPAHQVTVSSFHICIKTFPHI